MVDVSKQVTYWRVGSEEDAAVARYLVGQHHVRHGLFFAHLAIEKLLKAIVCLQTKDLAPRIHNLVRLAEIAGLNLSDAQRDFLAEMNQFNLEGRYPGVSLAPPDLAHAKQILEQTEGVLAWLTRALQR